MVEVMIVLLLSSGIAGIFEGSHMLSSLEGMLGRMARRFGRFPAMALTSIAVCCVFCNQTIGVIMCRQCMGRSYGSTPEERTALMLDIENSVITIAGLVPWCIASSVPLNMLGCDVRSLPFAAFLYLIPLCWHISLKRKERRTLRAKAA